MKPVRNTFVLLAIALGGLATTYGQDPLPSWNDGKTKQAIVSFVEKVTKEGSSDFVPPNERIATFDNDGTLWAEQPMYFQLIFALDRVKAMAPRIRSGKRQSRLRRCSKATSKPRSRAVNQPSGRLSWSLIRE